MLFVHNLHAQHQAHTAILSLVAWIIFGVLLIGRRRWGWRGHRAVNLTLAGIDWLTLRSGDRLEFGNAGPLLELTDFATPCDTQARWFRGGRTGRISARKHPEDARWYASVLREGPVAAGDEVRLQRD